MNSIDYLIYFNIGHPIYYENEWYRPDEIFQTKKTYIDILYNFHCQPFQEVYN